MTVFQSKAVNSPGIVQGISPEGDVEVDPQFSWSRRGPQGRQEMRQAITQLACTVRQSWEHEGFERRKGRI